MSGLVKTEQEVAVEEGFDEELAKISVAWKTFTWADIVKVIEVLNAMYAEPAGVGGSININPGRGGMSYVEIDDD